MQSSPRKPAKNEFRISFFGHWNQAGSVGLSPRTVQPSAELWCCGGYPGLFIFNYMAAHLQSLLYSEVFLCCHRSCQIPEATLKAISLITLMGLASRNAKWGLLGALILILPQMRPSTMGTTQHSYSHLYSERLRTPTNALKTSG